MASGTVSHLYNGYGQRVHKSGPGALVPTGEAHYLYDEAGQLLGEYDASGQPLYETIYLGSLPVGVIKHTGSAAGNDLAATLYNVHADQIATARVITRQDQTIVWRWDTAEAFGGSLPDQDPSALGAFIFNQRFPGQVFDADSGLLQNINREYDPRTGRYRQFDPTGLEDGPNGYLYVGGDPLTYTDPYGLFKWADMPLMPQGTIDFSAGMGDVILFGQGQRLRDLFDVDGGVDTCSGEYSAGEWAGVAAGVATGLVGGLKAAGAKGAGKEFSHWIPNRMGGPRSMWNGNYVPTATHALSDPYRYRFMPKAWKTQNPMPSRTSQQWTRIPNAYKGGAAGAAYGAAGAAQAGCTCR
jgi:RHS repeat-associated protein